MTVWVVVQIGFYDGEELVSVHSTEASARAEAARLDSLRKGSPSAGPFRVVERTVLP